MLCLGLWNFNDVPDMFVNKQLFRAGYKTSCLMLFHTVSEICI